MQPFPREVRDWHSPSAAGLSDTASDPEVDNTISLDARTPHPPGRFSTLI